MSKFSEFLDKFISVEKIETNDDVTKLAEALSRGCILRNDNKARLEFWHIPHAGYAGENPFAWINYSALINDPEKSLKMFIYYRL